MIDSHLFRWRWTYREKAACQPKGREEECLWCITAPDCTLCSTATRAAWRRVGAVTRFNSAICTFTTKQHRHAAASPLCVNVSISASVSLKCSSQYVNHRWSVMPKRKTTLNIKLVLGVELKLRTLSDITVSVDNWTEAQNQCFTFSASLFTCNDFFLLLTVKVSTTGFSYIHQQKI